MKKRWIVIAAEIMICMVVFIIAAFKKYDAYEAGYSVEKISENSARYSFDQAFDAGSYDINIEYTAKDDKTGYRFAGRSEDDFKTVDAWFQSSVTGYFSDHADTKKLQVILNFREDKLAFDVTDIGEGFEIKRILVSGNNQSLIIIGLRLLLLFILADIICIAVGIYRKKQRGEKTKMLAVGITLLVFVSSLPLLFHGLNDTYDIPTHLLRIEGIKEALLSGQFPARIHPIQTYGYGYASSIFYPELFLYIPAFFRICAIPVIASFKLFLVLVNVMTVIIAYFSFYGIFKKEWASFCGAVLYTLSPYRIGDVYYRQSVGEYLAFMAFPLIAYGIYRILKEDDENSFLILAAGFTIVLQSHILSVLYVAVGCLVAALVFHREFFVKKSMLQAGKAVLFTLLLNLWYIVPFIRFFMDKYNTFGEYIQGRGLSVTQLFLVFLYPVVKDPYISGTVPYGIGLAVLACLFMGSVLYSKDKPYARMAFWGTLSGATLALMSTRYFPWDRIAHMGGFIQKIVFNIQFPARMCEPMTICLVLAAVAALIWAGERYREYDPVIFTLIIMVCSLSFIQSAAFTDNIIQKNDMFSLTLMDMDTTLVGVADEYYPEGVTHESLDNREKYIELSDEDISITDYEKKGSNISMYVTNSGVEGWVDVPMAAYPGISSKDAAVLTAPDGVVRITVPAGYSGTVKVGYRENPVFIICDLISLITLIGLVISNSTGRSLRRKKI